MKLVFKIFWKIKRILASRIKYLAYKLTQGSYFKKIGDNVAFYGKQRFGSVENNISVGDNSMIGDGVFFSCSKGGEIKIGKNCSINSACHLVAVSGITIGDNTRIAEFVSIRDQNHNFSDIHTPIVDQGFTASEINIGEDVWIGRGAVILPGVTIGKGCVIGANSVVNKSFEPFTILAGVPAKKIRMRH